MIADKIRQLIEPALNTMGYELVGCELQTQGRTKLLRIYMDSEKGVNLADCALASRQISAILDVEDLIVGHYQLEMSSPGLDRPLMQPEHFKRYIGRSIKVRLRTPREEGRRQYSGTLLQVGDKGIVLTVEEKGVLNIDFSDIEKANLIPQL